MDKITPHDLEATRKVIRSLDGLKISKDHLLAITQALYDFWARDKRKNIKKLALISAFKLSIHMNDSATIEEYYHAFTRVASEIELLNHAIRLQSEADNDGAKAFTDHLVEQIIAKIRSGELFGA